MIDRIQIEKIGKRISWLKELLYRPFKEIDLEIAETKDHRRDLNLRGLAFSPIKPKTTWGEEGGSAWFRGSYVLKEEDRGKKLLLAINTGGESLVYIDGQEASAIDRQHNEIPLSAEESAPHQHQILIESYAGHRVPNVDPKPLSLKRGSWEEPPFLYPFPPQYTYCRLIERDTKAWELYYHLETLYGIALQLPADSMRKHHLFKALNLAVNTITWESKDQKKRDTELQKAIEVLEPELQKKNSPTTPLLNLIGHAHIDIAWLWPLKETIRKCGRTFATQLRMMEEYPEYMFLQSQAKAYAFVEERYPQLFSRIKKAIKEGSWEVEGGMWVEADTNVPSLESLIRQFLLGKGYFKETFGLESRVLWLPDVFGYNGNLPQILKGCGVDYFITSKIGWNDTNVFPYDLFRWRGIDGSLVLAHFIKETYNGLAHPTSILETYRAFQQKELTDRLIHAVGYGDGGGGITMEHLEYARRLRDLEGCPKVLFGSVEKLMDSFHEDREERPIWQGELYLEYHRGTLTSQAKTKRDNRKLESLLQSVEFFSSMAYLYGAPYPKERLNHCWQELLTNQFHDILPGSSIQEVYEDCHRIYGQVARSLDTMLEEALLYLEKRGNGNSENERESSRETRTIKVWNTLSFERRDLVEVPLLHREDEKDRIGDYIPLERGLSLPSEPIQIFDEKGREIDYERNEERLLFSPGSIPSYGYRSFTIERGLSKEKKERSSLAAAKDQLMNEHLLVRIDDRGRLTSVFDKEGEREVLPKGEKGNTLILAEDLPLDYDAWDIESYYHEVEKRVETPITLEGVFTSPLEAKVKWRRSFGEASMISQEIILRQGSRRIDFVTEVDWQERHALLKVAFPIDVQAERGVYEIQGGLIERPSHTNTSWDQARFEVCGHRWGALVEMDYGAALLNDCKYGYEGLPKELRLTLLKSATGPDIEADRGRHMFTYSLYPFRGSLQEGRVVEEGYALNTPYLIELGDHMRGEKKSFFKLEGHGVVLLTVKKAEREEGLILRLYEAYGRRSKVLVKLPSRASRVYEVNMIEERKEKLGEDMEEISLLFRPFVMRAFLIQGLIVS